MGLLKNVEEVGWSCLGLVHLPHASCEVLHGLQGRASFQGLIAPIHPEGTRERTQKGEVSLRQCTICIEVDPFSEYRSVKFKLRFLCPQQKSKTNWELILTKS